MVANESRIARGWQPIFIGVGLHTGSLILGTVGEDERMNSTVKTPMATIPAAILMRSGFFT